jgi:hypothetical protein
VERDAPDDDAGMSPEASMELIARERRHVGKRLGVNPAPIFALWGVAFLVGWGACYLAVPQGPGPFLPVWAAITILVVLYAAAIALPIVIGVRAGRGVRGPSRLTGAMYGWGWALGFGALAVINAGLYRQGMAEETVSLLWSGTALLVTGLMYLAGGMLWRDLSQYALGVWMLVAAAGSVFAGMPGDFLVLSLAGGGGFLLWAGFWTVTGRGRR